MKITKSDCGCWDFHFSFLQLLLRVEPQQTLSSLHVEVLKTTQIEYLQGENDKPFIEGLFTFYLLTTSLHPIMGNLRKVKQDKVF
jgi:hypothetical protein